MGNLEDFRPCAVARELDNCARATVAENGSNAAEIVRNACGHWEVQSCRGTREAMSHIQSKTYLMSCSSSVHVHLVRLRECLKKTGFVYQELTEIPFSHTISLKIAADENCFICVVR